MQPPTSSTAMGWRRSQWLPSVLAIVACFLIPCSRGQFSMPSDDSVSFLVSNGPLDRVYVSVGANVYSLSQDLQQHDHRALDGDATVSGMAVSDDGQWLVICAQDSRCLVVNGSTISAEPNRTKAGAIAGGSAGVALFTDTGDTFYTGGTGTDQDGLGNAHILGQFGLAGNNLERLFGEISVPSVFTRVMYGGFYNSPYAYYVAVDTEMVTSETQIRIVRVCNETASVGESDPFAAVYEVELDCDSVESIKKLTGVSLINGKTLVLGVTFMDSSTVCLYTLASIDSVMDSFYNACLVGDLAFSNNVEAWSGSIYEQTCDSYPQPKSMCDFSAAQEEDANLRVIAPSPAYVSGIIPILDTEVSGIDPAVLNGLTQSMAIFVDEQTLLYLGYSEKTTTNHFLMKYHLNGSVATLVDNTALSSGVTALSWSQGSDFVYIATHDSDNVEVVRVPLENCSSYLTCSECVASPDPLCGWCSVEAKCSRVIDCQNSDVSGRYLENGQTGNCFDTVTVEPVPFNAELVMQDRFEVNLMFSPGDLPQTLPGEKYFCRFSSPELSSPFVTPLQNKQCVSVEALVNDMTSVKMVTTFTIYSNLTEVDFVNVSTEYSFINCTLTDRCSVCVTASGDCGWCALDFNCTALNSTCTGGVSMWRTLSMGQNYEDVCPLLLPSNGSDDQSYSQPVSVESNFIVYGKNLPNANYECVINGVAESLTGERLSEEVVQCVVGFDDVTFTESNSDSIGQEVRGFELKQLHVSTEASYTVETVDQLSINVTLYQCSALASESDCSLCLAQSVGTGFQCGWCYSMSSFMCAVNEECLMNGHDFVTQSGDCPLPMIEAVSPSMGPPQGGTTIVIEGSNLGVDVTDIISITVDDLVCNVTNYASGRSITCVLETGVSTVENDTIILLRIMREGGSAPIVSAGGHTDYTLINPHVISVQPSFGPASGGTTVVVTGFNLDIGNVDQTRVQFLQDTTKRETTTENVVGNCTITDINSTTIVCISGAVADEGVARSSGPVQVTIDSAKVTMGGVTFDYREDPSFVKLTPLKTIPSGGITLTFTGSNLDVAQFPVFQVTDSRFNETLAMLCQGTPTTLKCVAPRLNPAPSEGDFEQQMLNYTVIVDNAPGPDFTAVDLELELKRDPVFSSISERMVQTESNTSLTIVGQNLDSVEQSEVTVTVGESDLCHIRIIGDSQLICTAPIRQEPVTEAVRVQVGGNLEYSLGEVMYYSEGDENNVTPIVVGFVVGFVVLAAVIFPIVLICVYVAFRRQSKLKDQKLVNLLSQMETMELDMADQCKQAFAELQTELEEIVSDEVMDRQHLPFHDFPHYAMKVLFPSGKEDHPVLHPPKFPPASPNEEYTRLLEEFRDLVFDKKFLVTFIRTLEAQPRFTLSEKCNVASLLMVTCQGDLIYATDILQTLLGELIRRNITQTRSNPKLLLRRTESVAEKLLANWFCFLLYPYMLDHAGAPLFILFKAVKRQLEKGPIDVITGEARNSLSEEKLLRQALDFKTIECEVETGDPNEVLTIKLLDTDSISQTKEKLLDLIYRNTPVSQRPSIGDVELELCKGNAGIILRDHDSTSRKDQDWVKINTLGHFGIPDMAEAAIEDPKKSTPRFRLGSRNERPMSVDYCDVPGTIISSASVMSTTSLLASVQTMEVGARMYHLVKPDAGEETTGKIVSEVFLTRLLSTKRILQQYVDNLFHVIFAIPHGKVLPRAIKFLFDFLDMQAASMGISDPDILHTWKTNSLPLRFWVNLIKNPDFVFDINKSATVDACLTIIAQAYIDACSTSDFRYTKDTPSARLLYANEVKQYKEEVLQYYNGIQSQPNLSTEEMNQYLTDIQQEFEKHQHFCPDSAILELYRYAQLYGDELVENLAEDGLALMAAQFGHLRRKFML